MHSRFRQRQQILKTCCRKLPKQMWRLHRSSNRTVSSLGKWSKEPSRGILETLELATHKRRGRSFSRLEENLREYRARNPGKAGQDISPANQPAHRSIHTKLMRYYSWPVHQSYWLNLLKKQVPPSLASRVIMRAFMLALFSLSWTRFCFVCFQTFGRFYGRVHGWMVGRLSGWMNGMDGWMVYVSVYMNRY